MSVYLFFYNYLQMSCNKPNNSVILIFVVWTWANSTNIYLLNLGLDTYSSFSASPIHWKTTGIEITIIITQEVFQYLAPQQIWWENW